MSDVTLHRNGNGRILDISSAIGSDCFLSADSYIERESHVSLHSSIFSSGISHSAIVASSIESSVIANSHIAGADVGEAVVQNAVVRGTDTRRADVGDVLLSGVVVEACTLRGFELHGPFLVHANWNRQPRHHLLESENGVRIGLIECTDDRFHAGCACRPFSKWDESEAALRHYFTKRGWPLETFDSIRGFFESWRNNPI